MFRLLAVFGLLFITAGSVLGQRVAAGQRHTVAIRRDGSLWAWGDNGSGQLGDGTTLLRTAPVQVGTDKNWLSAAAGPSHTVAIRRDGTLWGWGNNEGNVLADTTRINQWAPMQIGKDAAWQQVAPGPFHTLAIRRDGTLWGWGSNGGGQVGDSISEKYLIPVQIGTGNTWKQVAVGQHHSVAVRGDGTLWGWGTNDVGELGDSVMTESKVPRQIGTGSDWEQVAAGFEHTVALRRDGTLWSCGLNHEGQLGVDKNRLRGRNRSHVLLQIDSAAWRHVAAGYNYNLGTRRDGTLWKWGGEADWTGSPTSRPEQVGKAANWQEVSLGKGHIAAARTDGSVWAWGDNSHGQVGSKQLGVVAQVLPRQLSDDRGWQRGMNGTADPMALRKDGSLWVWGGDVFSKGVPIGPAVAPVRFGKEAWKAVSALGGHALAVRSDGTLWEWGDQLNDPPRYSYFGLDQESSPAPEVPAQVGKGNGWQEVAAGNMRFMLLNQDGSLWEWGDVCSDQDSTGDRTYERKAPARIGESLLWIHVDSYDQQNVGLRRDGSLWVWWITADGDITIEPEQIGKGNTWQRAWVGKSHLLALRSDSTLWTWENNVFWQWDHEAGTQQQVPVQVGAGGQWQLADAGGAHQLGIRRDGTLWVWGSNETGQLGDGTTARRVKPKQIGVEKWADVSAGANSTLAVGRDGTLWGWGLIRVKNTEAALPVKVLKK